MIGRELYPLLSKAGYSSVRVSPRMVYADSSRPEMVEGFTRNTFTAMIEGVREQAIRSGMIEPEAFDEGIRDLYRTAEEDGVFCYTFFKATAKKRAKFIERCPITMPGEQLIVLSDPMDNSLQLVKRAQCQEGRKR